MARNAKPIGFPVNPYDCGEHVEMPRGVIASDPTPSGYTGEPQLTAEVEVIASDPTPSGYTIGA